MSDTLHTLTTPLGPMLLRSSPSGLSGAWFVGQRHFPDLDVPRSNSRVPDHPILAQACQQLGEYFTGQRRQFSLPLDLTPGTPFQQSVWNALLTIDWGHTARYGELALSLKAARDVAAVRRDFYEGLSYALAGMLMTPKFLFVIDMTEADPAHPGSGRPRRRGVQVLDAAALTYVAALLQSVSQVLYYAMILSGNRRRDD